MKKTIIFIFAFATSSLSYAALFTRDLDGDLLNGHEGVYDDVLDITWLADANVASSNNFGLSTIGIDGKMNWYSGEELVGTMNNSNYLGVSIWRQPIARPVDGNMLNEAFAYDGSSDTGWQISAEFDNVFNPTPAAVVDPTGSELAYHYYNNLGGIGSCNGSGSILNTCIPSSQYGVDNATNDNNLVLFENIQNEFYSTGTSLSAPSALPRAWVFGMINGNQGTSRKIDEDYFVWVVADGDHGQSVVPVPATIWLFGQALFCLALKKVSIKVKAIKK